jgi:hypothetical protein
VADISAVSTNATDIFSLQPKSNVENLELIMEIPFAIFNVSLFTRMSRVEKVNITLSFPPFQLLRLLNRLQEPPGFVGITEIGRKTQGFLEMVPRLLFLANSEIYSAQMIQDDGMVR